MTRSEVLTAEYRADDACDVLARSLQEEISRSIKLLTEAREALGHMGYTQRSLKPTGGCIQDLEVLEEVIKIVSNATDVCFDDELPSVQRLVAEYREISGYDSPVFEPCREEA